MNAPGICATHMHPADAQRSCDAPMHVRTYVLTDADASNTEMGPAVRNARDLRRNRTGLEGWESFDWASLPDGQTGPRSRCAVGWLYVVEFSFGVVKVGQSIDPRHRIQSHIKDAARFRGTVLRFWISQPHEQWMSNEGQLLLWCFRHGRQTFGEYFAGLDFVETADYAHALIRRRKLKAASQ